MDNKTKFTAILTLTLSALSQNSHAHMEPKKGDGMEKCYGVVKANRNDCASKASGHSCATMAQNDKDTNEWIKLPAGLCTKLAGGIIKEDSNK